MYGSIPVSLLTNNEVTEQNFTRYICLSRSEALLDNDPDVWDSWVSTSTARKWLKAGDRRGRQETVHHTDKGFNGKTRRAEK
jgi:hypothetical protein